MKLLNLTWARYRVPFREAFHMAHGVLSHRSGALVTMYTEDGCAGWGEIAPLPEHSGQNLGESLEMLPRLARELQGRELQDILSFLEARSMDGQLPAPLICGLEAALLDASAQARGLRLADLLASNYSSGKSHSPSVPRTLIPVNAVISGPTIEAAVAS